MKEMVNARVRHNGKNKDRVYARLMHIRAHTNSNEMKYAFDGCCLSRYVYHEEVEVGQCAIIGLS